MGRLSSEAEHPVDGFDALYDRPVVRAVQVGGLLCGRREQVEDAVAIRTST